MWTSRNRCSLSYCVGILVSLSLFSLIAPLLGFARQQGGLPAQQRMPGPPPGGGVRERLVSILIPSLPDAPFTAALDTISLRTMPNGAEIKLKNHRKIARDRRGRIFQERRMLVPDDGSRESALTQIEISDPVKQELYICKPANRVCELEVFRPPEGPDPTVVFRELSGPGVEHLGKQTIQGIETVGTRQSAVIEAGTIGNDRPLMAQREFWFSSRLGINLSSMREDPHSGLQRFDVSEIGVGEPDAKLFEVPAGYKVLDLREPKELPPDSSSRQ